MADLELVEINRSKNNMDVDEKQSCTYCRVANSVSLYTTSSIFGDEFSLDKCSVCGAFFLNPSPTEEQLGQAYDDSYYGTGDSKFGSGVEKVLDVFRGARGRRVRGYVKPGGRVLDIGCGSGDFLKKLSERGFEAFGTELDGQAARRAMQVDGIKVKTGPLLEADFDKDFFDAVCMWHVFEHLAEPKRTLEIISKILKPGGYLFLSMPNIESIQSRLFKGRWLHLDPPRHLFFLSPEKLVSVVKDEAAFDLNFLLPSREEGWISNLTVRKSSYEDSNRLEMVTRENRYLAFSSLHPYPEQKFLAIFSFHRSDKPESEIPWSKLLCADDREVSFNIARQGRAMKYSLQLDTMEAVVRAI